MSSGLDPRPMWRTSLMSWACWAWDWAWAWAWAWASARACASPPRLAWAWGWAWAWAGACARAFTWALAQLGAAQALAWAGPHSPHPSSKRSKSVRKVVEKLRKGYETVVK